MTIEKWFEKASEALTIGSSKYRLDARACMLVTAVISTLSLTLGLRENIILVATAIVVLVVSSGAYILAYSLIVITPFIAFYVISSLVVQFIVKRHIEFIVVELNSCRMLTIALYSISMASMLRVSDLIQFLRKASLKLAVGVALAIKSFYLTVKEAQRVAETYNSWFSYKHGLRMVIFKAELIAKTISYIALARAIETAESLYTRQVAVGLSAHGKLERDRGKASQRACGVKIVCEGD